MKHRKFCILSFPCGCDLHNCKMCKFCKTRFGTQILLEKQWIILKSLNNAQSASSAIIGINGIPSGQRKLVKKN